MKHIGMVAAFVLAVFVVLSGSGLAFNHGMRSLRANNPHVSSVFGRFVEGENVTIYGSGFGTRSFNDTLLWDDFERGTNNTTLPDNPEIGNWSIINGGPVYTNLTAHSGNLSATSYYPDGGGYRNIRWEPLSLETGAKYYQYYWFRYYSPENGTGQTKLTQVWGTEQINDYSPGIMTGGFAGDWWATYIALEDSGAYNATNYGFTPARNEWHLFEMEMMQSDVNVSNGAVRIWIDGRIIYNESPVKTREHEGQGWLFTTFFDGMTNWNNATQTWVDDCYFSSSWARVMIANNASFWNSTHREIEIPLNWTNGKIVIDFNAGSFNNGDNVYLFVINDNGNVSNSYPIKIGGSEVPEFNREIPIFLFSFVLMVPIAYLRRLKEVKK